MSPPRRSKLVLTKAERAALRRASIRLADLATLEPRAVVERTARAVTLERAEQLCGMAAYASTGIRHELAGDLLRAGYLHPRELAGLSAFDVARTLERTLGSFVDDRSLAALDAAIARVEHHGLPPLPGNTRRAALLERPRAFSLDEVRIGREGETAVIEPADPSIAVTHFPLGPALASMSDADVLARFNETMNAMVALRAELDLPAIEIPPGRPQIEWSERASQWSARGHVLRCIVTDDEQGEPHVVIDDKQLDWAQFGRLVCSFAGWGMRIAFVADDEIEDEPNIAVREPDERPPTTTEEGR